MKIDAYSFGSITIDGKIYDNDLIIFPDKVKSNWWRKQGHVLDVDDLTEVIESKPQILIIGTGASGLMQIAESTRKKLQSCNIQLIEDLTKQACEIFNKKVAEDKNIVGAFHLTC